MRRLKFQRGPGDWRCELHPGVGGAARLEVYYGARLSKAPESQDATVAGMLPVAGGQRELCGSRKSPFRPIGPVDPTPIRASLAAPKLMSFRHTSMAGQDQDASQKPQCPTCGAAEARALLCAPPAIVYVSCRACGAAWGIRERRRWRRQPEDPLDRFLPEHETE